MRKIKGQPLIIPNTMIWFFKSENLLKKTINKNGKTINLTLLNNNKINKFLTIFMGLLNFKNIMSFIVSLPIS
jgi:hypothetical protein